jgi:hypothetical protein
VALRVPVDGNRQACIRRVLGSLVEERRYLRRTGADAALLEASGLAIATGSGNCLPARRSLAA